MTGTPLLDPRLLDAVADAWERGWRPADLVHALGRTEPILAGLAAAAIVAGVEALSDRVAVPEEWQRQLGDVAERAGGVPGHAEDVHRLLLRLRMLPPLPQLGDPPSRWAAATPGTSEPPSTGRRDETAPRALHRIRSLLAKAESTDFPEEAEALTAKAQELMAVHAIDAAMLDSGDTSRPGGADVTERRMHLEPPYLQAKMHLVSAVAGANGVRTAWFGSLGIAVLVGLPSDLDAVELLATSLLVQAGRALAAAGRGDRHARSRGYRRAFLLAYAVRVGERLAESRATAVADAVQARRADLAPVLHSREVAVTRAFEELFPRLRTRRTTSVDRTGWLSGRSAADSADLARKRPLPS
ncbi:DUF2786 domain-containing protein [Blastococcus sp. TF02A-26]|uniref:DUF2786 domain-containing protein n=1 Tax=Blastococcus sp. TF02A-26 TaxID=2250577 RepID=UPI000DEB911F|nr:DUF2786 domain-containing protein [Blastococcus sp. TF02A-26]RBY79936.1 hypothetical protein DQ240_21820 [Blastococcus sp. TF02A-26]